MIALLPAPSEKVVHWASFFQILSEQNKALQSEVQKLQTAVSQQVSLCG
jgi:hypothetical protein